MGPVFFQSVVAAVVPFELVVFSLWFRSYLRHKGQPGMGKDKVRPHAPAIVTIVMVLLISLLAFAAILVFVLEQDRPQDLYKPTPVKLMIISSPGLPALVSDHIRESHTAASFAAVFPKSPAL